MSLKRGINKRAQTDGGSGGTIVTWIIVIALLVIALVALSYFFTPLFSDFKTASSGTSGLPAIVTACEGYATSSLQTSYCTFNPITVNGVSEYVSCADSKVQSQMPSSDQGLVNCDQSGQNSSTIAECAVLLQDGISNPIVNEQYCSSYATELYCSSASVPASVTSLASKGIVTQSLQGIESTAGCPISPTSNVQITYTTSNPQNSTYTRAIKQPAFTPVTTGNDVCCVVPISL